MNTKTGVFTLDEMAGLASSALPTRGPVCPKCGAHIPQFADLTEEDEARLRKLILEGRKMMAMHELRDRVHCPFTWAKIWVLHGGRPDGIGTTAPCPYCGKPLKTALAKQCQHCNMDWHDLNKPKRLGANK
jgi:hypothetical protein